MHEDHSVLGLSTIRRNRGITLEQIANATKISVRSLQAIEHGEFAKLPGGIYNTSYIRQYARAIDYDEGRLLDFYHNAASPKPGVVSQPGSSNGTFGGYRPASTILRS